MTTDVSYAIAYRIDYVAADGRSYTTAVYTLEDARARVAEIKGEGGRIVEKSVERGAGAASLLCAVRQAELSAEVF